MHKIVPNWQVPTNIHSFTTTRLGGVSLPPFDSFNLAIHVGDAKNSVEMNRSLLVSRENLPQRPLFLNQTHSTNVITLPYPHSTPPPEADAVYTCTPKQICVVMTADCLPILLTNQQGNEVAAIHAGWRGLCDGVIEETINKFQCPPAQIIAWLGPAIGPLAFQVGEEVRQQFIQQDPQAQQAFCRDKTEAGYRQKFLANLYLLARQRLNRLGINAISGGEYCTYQQKQYFFSYRREGQTGRMASLIWFD